MADNMKLILASGSPRRKELLAMAGFTFEVRLKNTDETHPENTTLDDVPLLLAERKAKAFINEINDDELIIAADTVVILNNLIFEKPKDRADAIRMLSELSGNTHKVVTGVCLLSKNKTLSFKDETLVTFNALALPEIEFYVDTYKPYDKAGSYACQEWIGAVAIKRFDGDYFNVVGLPVNRVYQLIKDF